MKKLSVGWALLVFLLLPLILSAGTFSSIVAFGDSLSDNGAAEDEYGFGTFTNGSVWVEYLADSDHLNCDLYDYAFGGATTGYDNPAAGLTYTGMNWQVDQYLLNLNNAAIADGTLFTLWAGGNDFLNLPPDATPEQVVGTIGNAVSNIQSAVTKLVGAGAEDILVLNLPNLGATPLNNTNPVAAAGAQWITQTYNFYLGLAMAEISALHDVNLNTLDVYGLMEEMLANPEKFGFDNVTEMLIAAGATSDTYLFWDTIHPTTQAHALIADYAQAEVAPVPEPATMILFGAGLAGIAGMRRRFLRG